MWILPCLLLLFSGMVTSARTNTSSGFQQQLLPLVSIKDYYSFIRIYRHFCGGSILSKDWILTAGHCFSERPDAVDNVVVDVGSEYLNNTLGTRHNISDFFMHPEFSQTIRIIKNDLCLIKLATPIQFTATVQPVHLGTIEDQKELKVVGGGWGRTSDDGEAHQRLRYVDLTTLKYKDCKRMHAKRNNTIDRETHICGYGGLGTTLCFGDSGGPLFDLDTGYQVAVFSGLEDCSGKYPVLFMKFEPFIGWIDEVTKLNLTLN